MAKIDYKSFGQQLIDKIDLKLIVRDYFELDWHDDGKEQKRVISGERINNLSKKLTRIRRSQQITYQSLLAGIDNELSKPSNHMDSSQRRVSIKLARLNQKGGLERVDVSVPIGGKALSEKTIKIKAENPKLSKTYWKHTGRLSRAFKAAVKQQVAGLNGDDFMTAPKAILAEIKSSMVASNHNKTVKASATVEIKVPKWEGANADLMDDLITKPYAGIKPKSPFSYLAAGTKAMRDKIIASLESKGSTEHLIQEIIQTHRDEDSRRANNAAKKATASRSTKQPMLPVTKSKVTTTHKSGDTTKQKYDHKGFPNDDIPF